jgi:hypothetical protein
MAKIPDLVASNPTNVINDNTSELILSLRTDLFDLRVNYFVCGLI